MPDGDYSLTVDYRTGELGLPVEIPGPDVVFTLPASGEVHVRVLDLELEYRRGWLEGVTLELTSIDSPGSTVLVVEPLDVEGLAPGLWQATVIAPDGRSWTAPVEVLDKQSIDVILD